MLPELLRTEYLQLCDWLKFFLPEISRNLSGISRIKPRLVTYARVGLFKPYEVTNRGQSASAAVQWATAQ